MRMAVCIYVYNIMRMSVCIYVYQYITREMKPCVSALRKRPEMMRRIHIHIYILRFIYNIHTHTYAHIQLLAPRFDAFGEFKADEENSRARRAAAVSHKKKCIYSWVQ